MTEWWIHRYHAPPGGMIIACLKSIFRGIIVSSVASLHLAKFYWSSSILCCDNLRIVKRYISDMLILETFQKTFRPLSNWEQQLGHNSTFGPLFVTASHHPRSNKFKQANMILGLSWISFGRYTMIIHDLHCQIRKTQPPHATPLLTELRRSSVGRGGRGRCCSVRWTSAVTTPSMRPRMQGWDKDGQRSNE